MVFILVGLIMVVGRLAAYMHPEKIPPKKHIKLLLDRTEDLTSLTTKSGNEMEEVDPNEYMHTFLRKQGIEAYELLPTKIWTNHLVQNIQATKAAGTIVYGKC